jgi:hypothetical protein
VKASSVDIRGPTAIGVDVFTAGHVEMSNCSIRGMSDVVIWAHLAGSGVFYEMDLCPDPSKRPLKPVIFRPGLRPQVVKGLPQEKIVRCETSRPVVVETKRIIRRIELNRNGGKAVPGVHATPSRCKICHVEVRDFMFMPCRHMLYCKQCWQTLDPKPTQCELCFDSILRTVSLWALTREGETDFQCEICCSAPIDSVVSPCGHTLCASCASAWFAKNKGCPFCRADHASAHLFVSYQ